MALRPRARLSSDGRAAIRAIERINRNFQGKNRVQVGLPKNSLPYGDGTSVIMVGAVHEFGSPSRNVPQRSYIRTTTIEKKRDYKRLFQALAVRMRRGEIDMTRAMGLLGIQVEGDIKQKITDISEPPLRYREGNPLDHTGHLRGSIRYQVLNAGEVD